MPAHSFPLLTDQPFATRGRIRQALDTDAVQEALRAALGHHHLGSFLSVLASKIARKDSDVQPHKGMWDRLRRARKAIPTASTSRAPADDTTETSSASSTKPATTVRGAGGLGGNYLNLNSLKDVKAVAEGLEYVATLGDQQPAKAKAAATLLSAAAHCLRVVYSELVWEWYQVVRDEACQTLLQTAQHIDRCAAWTLACTLTSTAVRAGRTGLRQAAEHTVRELISAPSEVASLDAVSLEDAKTFEVAFAKLRGEVALTAESVTKQIQVATTGHGGMTTLDVFAASQAEAKLIDDAKSQWLMRQIKQKSSLLVSALSLAQTAYERISREGEMTSESVQVVPAITNRTRSTEQAE